MTTKPKTKKSHTPGKSRVSQSLPLIERNHPEHSIQGYERFISRNKKAIQHLHALQTLDPWHHRDYGILITEARKQQRMFKAAIKKLEKIQSGGSK